LAVLVPLRSLFILAVVLLSIVSLGLVMAWLLGPLLFICGAGGLEWDGGEFQHCCGDIRDKDTERGGTYHESFGSGCTVVSLLFVEAG
jgi:hypothetical protein